MIKEEEGIQKTDIDISSIIPWNSKEFPVKVNNIRYNQDNSLFTLATSKGYKIFSAASLIQVQEETNIVQDLGDLDIVMTYYSSSLVFFTATKYNEKYSTKELIVFDDFSQNKISSFKSNNERITNFYVGKYAIFIVLESKIIIIELISFKIINIIYNIYSDKKLCSFTVYGFVGFTKRDEKYSVYIKVLNLENNKIISIRNRCIKPNFEYIQNLQISPSGQFIALASIFFFFLHIYYVENLILKECFYLGNEINNIIKMSFPARQEGFLLVQISDKKFRIYQFSNILEGQFKCHCYKYKNEEMIKEVIKKKENEKGLINYIKKSYFNYDYPNNNALISFEEKEGILFLDFVENDTFIKKLMNNKKEIVMINEKGHYSKFSFDSDKKKYINNNSYNDILNLEGSVQWI